MVRTPRVPSAGLKLMADGLGSTTWNIIRGIDGRACIYPGTRATPALYLVIIVVVRPLQPTGLRIDSDLGCLAVL